MKKIIILFAALALLLSMAYAEGYYADTVFDVASDGSVAISGATNHADLNAQLTEKLTAKKDGIWTITINPTGEFSEYVYEIILPAGAQLIDVNTPNGSRIDAESARIKIIGTGEQTTYFVSARYITRAQPKEENLMFVLIGLMLLVIILIGIWGAGELRKRKKCESGATKITPSEKPKYNKEALTEIQLQIVEYLENGKGSATQAELQKKFELPKASLSRNLEGLERKGIIAKERKGMTMLVMLKKN
ncbi:Uncharacterised protein [uncultured archaeon]|nr:Uncharacterised protein [uncultured archaeon]